MVMRLRPELEQFIERQVKAGRFASRDEVLEAGLARLMLDPMRDELDERDVTAIDESERQIAGGEDLDWKQVSAQLRREYLGES
jgi:putative addiction module CopG family antidote